MLLGTHTRAHTQFPVHCDERESDRDKAVIKADSERFDLSLVTDPVGSIMTTRYTYCLFVWLACTGETDKWQFASGMPTHRERGRETVTSRRSSWHWTLFSLYFPNIKNIAILVYLNHPWCSDFTNSEPTTCSSQAALKKLKAPVQFFSFWFLSKRQMFQNLSNLESKFFQPQQIDLHV